MIIVTFGIQNSANPKPPSEREQPFDNRYTMKGKFVMKIALVPKLWTRFTVMIVLSLSFLTASAFAEIRYVSDLLIISVREGQADDSAIVGYIKSDTPVDVLEENENFVHVKAPDNLVGWVKKRFLVSEKPKTIIIEELKRRIIDLEDKIILLQRNPETGTQEDNTAELQDKVDTLQEDIEDQKQMVSKLENELRLANKKYGDLVEKNKQPPDSGKELQALKAKNQELSLALQKAKQKVQPSFFSGNNKWFLIGAGVLILGFIIGRSLRRKPKYRY
jgi:SH3 domain protein